MGCWDETDAITGIPIYSGEICYMIVIDYKGYEVMFGYDNINYDHVKMIEKGIYNDYGDLVERENSPSNPYNPNEMDIIIFIKEETWNFLLNNISELSIEDREPAARVRAELDEVMKREYNPLHLSQIFLDFYKICRFALRVRRSIITGWFWRGSQDYEYKKEDRLRSDWDLYEELMVNQIEQRREYWRKLRDRPGKNT